MTIAIIKTQSNNGIAKSLELLHYNVYYNLPNMPLYSFLDHIGSWKNNFLILYFCLLIAHEFGKKKKISLFHKF